MIESMALAVIVFAGLYLIGLGTVSLLAPSRAARFLLGFVSSARAHYLELFLRFVVGAALVLSAPRMLLPGAFQLAGWVLLVTSACLLLLPWRWHQRFAQQAVPKATRHLSLIGVASLAMGGFLLVAVVMGNQD